MPRYTTPLCAAYHCGLLPAAAAAAAAARYSKQRSTGAQQVAAGPPATAHSGRALLGPAAVASVSQPAGSLLLPRSTSLRRPPAGWLAGTAAPIPDTYLPTCLHVPRPLVPSGRPACLLSLVSLPPPPLSYFPLFSPSARVSLSVRCFLAPPSLGPTSQNVLESFFC